jgi:hypothetical protein
MKLLYIPYSRPWQRHRTWDFLQVEKGYTWVNVNHDLSFKWWLNYLGWSWKYKVFSFRPNRKLVFCHGTVNSVGCTRVVFRAQNWNMHVSAVAPKILLKNPMYTLLCGVYLAYCYSNKQSMQGGHLCRVNCLHFLKTRVLERSQKTFYLNCALHCRIMLQSIYSFV